MRRKNNVRIACRFRDRLYSDTIRYFDSFEELAEQMKTYEIVKGDHYEIWIEEQVWVSTTTK